MSAAARRGQQDFLLPTMPVASPKLTLGTVASPFAPSLALARRGSNHVFPSPAGPAL